MRGIVPPSEVPMRSLGFVCSLVAVAACGGKPQPPDTQPMTTAPSTSPPTRPAPDTSTAAVDAAPTPAEPDVATPAEPAFVVFTEQFADVRILRYRVPGFEALPLSQKRLVYHLSEAALAGRDIAWDQRHPQGLLVRRTLEAIDATYKGDKATPEYDKFLVYLKRVWFSHGIYHQDSNRKLEPGFSKETFEQLVHGSDPAALPIGKDETVDELVTRLTPLLFDPEVDPVAISTDSDKDLVTHSANNFYDRGVTQVEVEKFYGKRKDPKDPRPVMWGLNSKLAKRGTALEERPWKSGGMYGPAIDKIVTQLEAASPFAENDAQRAWIVALVDFYRTGDLARFDAFNIAWVKDTDSTVDAINGFIETYGDALDMRGTFEGIVQIKDVETSARIAAISKEAQWFEKHSPIMAEHKKPDVTGISARVVNVAVGVGDSGPAFPIGINLPNSDWIRKEHGSKSVMLGNIVDAIEADSAASGLVAEFMPDPEIRARIMRHGVHALYLKVDMHEVIGHASGQLEPGVAPASDTLKSFASSLEEARADLVALYFVMDQKLVDMGLMESLEVGKAAYDDYILRGLVTQLARIEPGRDLVQAHMRNRQLVSSWVAAKGGPSVIERVQADGKTTFFVRDHLKMRELVGELLREVQRIKSQGDYEAGKALVETYGTKVDPALHAEVLERYSKLGLAPLKGFINPRLVEVRDGGEVVDVRIEYPDDFASQMREYARTYSFLPTTN